MVANGPVVASTVFGIVLVISDADEDCSPLHVMRTSSSLNMLTPSFVKTETVPSSDVFPMLIRDVGKS